MRIVFPLSIWAAALLAGSPAADASTSCSHTGPPQNELRVLPYQDPKVDLDFADGDVYREGDAIRVRGLDPVPCAGPPATLAGTERVVILQEGLAFNALSLMGGPPWPGGPPESDGTAETEVTFVAEKGALGYAELIATAGPESWTLWRQPEELGVSLSPDRRHEFDVLLEGTGVHVPVIELGAGPDSYSSLVPSKFARKVLQIVRGGSGNDVLTVLGGKHVLTGGRGDDVVIGGTGGDSVTGGRGIDRLVAGGGKDTVISRDRVRDVVRCGPGRDTATVDAKDNVRGCEFIERRKRALHLRRSIQSG